MGFSFSGRVSRTWLLAGGSLTPGLTDAGLTGRGDGARWRSVILVTRVKINTRESESAQSMFQ